MTDVVLGVDSSTQSTKVEARDISTGQLLASGRASHPATSPPVSEQGPDSWWHALVDSVMQLPNDVRTRVTAMAIAGQQHGLTILDASGMPLRPAKLWNDTTSAAEADSLVAGLGAEVWADACGSVPVAAFTITKLAWVAAHEPELIPRISYLMLPHDYLTWRLCDRHVTDRGDASGTGWYDSASARFRPDLLALASPTADLSQCLPTVLGPWEAAGIITDRAARALGLPRGVRIGAGTGDNMAGALGLGLGPGDVAISLGTSGTVYAVSVTPTRDRTGAVAGFADATGAFLPLVCTMNATKVTETVARWLGTDAAGLSDLALSAGLTDGPTLVPYFDGERTPNRPGATGSFVGLTNSTTREALARAAYDGVLCGLLDGLDAIAAAASAITENAEGPRVGSGRMFVVGGGARSTAYRQRLADLAGRDVTVPDAAESVALGAGVQAAVGPGESGADVARRWQLGSGSVVVPRDGAEGQRVRSNYRANLR